MKIRIKKFGNNNDNLENDGSADELSRELTDNLGVKGIHELIGNITNGNIDTKTDLADREIKLITRLKFIAKEFKIKRMDSVLYGYMRLRLSKNRESRREIIDIIKNELSRENKPGFDISKFLGSPKT